VLDADAQHIRDAREVAGQLTRSPGFPLRDGAA